MIDVAITVKTEVPQTMFKNLRRNLMGYTANHMVTSISQLLAHNTQTFIKTGIGGYNKPPFDTGAMFESVRLKGHIKGDKKRKYQTIAVGGVKRLGKDVHYAGYVYYGMGPHRGNPRHFTDDAIRYSMNNIREIAAKELVDMVYRSRIRI